MAGSVIDLCSSPELKLPPDRPITRYPTPQPNSAAEDICVDLSSDAVRAPTSNNRTKPILSRSNAANDSLGGLGMSSSPVLAIKAVSSSKAISSDDRNSAKMCHAEATISGSKEGAKSAAAKAARNHWAKLPVLSSDNLSPVSTSKPLARNSVSAPGTTPSLQSNTKGGTDFVFLEDDFDTTILSDDDPFASSPPAKKRRLSPAQKATAVSKTRASGYQKSISNTRFSSKAGPSGTGLQRSRSGIEMVNRGDDGIQYSARLNAKKSLKALDMDPLIFTSSPDHIAEAAKKKKEKRRRNSVSDENNLEGISVVVPRKSELRKIEGKENLLLDLGLDLSSSDIDLQAIYTSKQSDRPSKISKLHSAESALAKYEALKTKGKAAREKVDKVKEKTEQTKSKKAEKEAEKARKQQEKEDKVKRKIKADALAKVNTLKTDKKKSTEEMIVDLPSCLNRKLIISVQTFLNEGDVKAENTEWESQLPIVKWRRKVVAEFNQDRDLWEPVEPRIDDEKHVMCILTAKELVELVIADEGQDLDCHILRLQADFEGKRMIYMIEGMTAWFRSNRNIKDRQFKDAVRSHAHQETAPSTASQKRKKKDDKFVDEDLVEEALLKLQVQHNALIHHTSALPETAEWIWTFTQHISTIPYRTQKNSLGAAFCMESGQVKTGENAADTYVKMLQEIVRITASIAYGIAAEYPTVQKLIEGLKKKGPLALEDCEKSANKDGAFSGKRIGPAISRRVYKVFLGRDAGSWDV